MLQLENIDASYGPVQVLRGISLHVERGETVALLGRNGVGKTTLAHTIAGLSPSKRGRILFEGEDITGLPIHRIAQLGIALVPQGRRIFPSLTVEENLIVAQRRRFRRSQGGGERAAWDRERVFELFPILEERREQMGTTLSGGEQQMLACARALIANPDLLVMDEPSEGLAPQKLRELRDLIGRLSDTGLAILLIEQNMRFAVASASRVYVMHRGGIGFHGSQEQLLSDKLVQEQLLAVAPHEQP
jgi:branched-chain amino acid transport system ATP-binding protein